jgi:hypothetical protein
MFFGFLVFNNKSISNGDVSNVTDMSVICFCMPQPSNVTDMSKLFANASSFNQNLSCWNVSNIDNMIEVFFDVQFGGKLWFYTIASRSAS